MILPAHPNSLAMALAGLLLLNGCTAPQSDDDRVKSNLLQILRAYTSLEKPPRDMDQLRSSVADMHAMNLGVPVEEALVSPRDHQPIVVIFGLSSADPADAVLAYEQTGVEGKRWVVNVGGDLKLLDEAGFSQSKFVHNHKPS